MNTQISADLENRKEKIEKTKSARKFEACRNEPSCRAVLLFSLFAVLVSVSGLIGVHLRLDPSLSV
jgi:hypothetical protein